jgi:hypothetical protein
LAIHSRGDNEKVTLRGTALIGTQIGPQYEEICRTNSGKNTDVSEFYREIKDGEIRMRLGRD